MLLDNLGPRQVVADFSGGILSTEGGVLLPRQIDRGLQVSASLAGCFHDERDARWVEHRLPELVAQRLMGLGWGMRT